MGTSDQQGVTLDPDNPVEAALIAIVETHRKKNQDYSEDGRVFSNFELTAELVNQLPEESAIFNVAQKLVRLRNLKQNGRTLDPANESVRDTYLDLATYAVIALAIVRESAREVAAEQRKELLEDVAEEINHTVRTGDVRKAGEFSHVITVNTTGRSSDQIAAETARQLNGIDWARKL